MPRLDDEKELRRFMKVFHNISPSKKKFIDYLTGYLEQETNKMEEKILGVKQEKRIDNFIRLADAF